MPRRLHVPLRALHWSLASCFFLLALLLLLAPASTPSVTSIRLAPPAPIPVALSHVPTALSMAVGHLHDSAAVLVAIAALSRDALLRRVGAGSKVTDVASSAAVTATAAVGASGDNATAAGICGSLLPECARCPPSPLTPVCVVVAEPGGSGSPASGIDSCVAVELPHPGGLNAVPSAWCKAHVGCRGAWSLLRAFVRGDGDEAMVWAATEARVDGGRIRCGFLQEVPELVGAARLGMWPISAADRAAEPAAAWINTSARTRSPRTAASAGHAASLLTLEVGSASVTVGHAVGLATVTATYPLTAHEADRGAGSGPGFASVEGAPRFYGVATVLCVVLSVLLGFALELASLRLQRLGRRVDLVAASRAAREANAVERSEVLEVEWWADEAVALAELAMVEPDVLAAGASAAFGSSGRSDEGAESSHREHSLVAPSYSEQHRARAYTSTTYGADDSDADEESHFAGDQGRAALPHAVPRSAGASPQESFLHDDGGSLSSVHPNRNVSMVGSSAALPSSARFGAAAAVAAAAAAEGSVAVHGSVVHIAMHKFHQLVLSDVVEAERVTGDLLSDIHTAARATDGFVAHYTAECATVVWNCVIPRIAHEGFALRFTDLIAPKLGHYHDAFLTVVTGPLLIAKFLKPPLITGRAISRAASLSAYQRCCGCRVAVTDDVVFKALSRDVWRVRPLDILMFADDTFNERAVIVHELLPATLTAHQRSINAADFVQLQRFFSMLQKGDAFGAQQLLRGVSCAQRVRRWQEICAFLLTPQGSATLEARGMRYFRKDRGWALPGVDAAARRPQAPLDATNAEGLVHSEHAAAPTAVLPLDSGAPVVIGSEQTSYEHLPIRFGPADRQWTRSDKRLATQRHCDVFLGTSSEGTPVAISCVRLGTCPPEWLAWRMNAFVVGAKLAHRHSASVRSINRINDQFLLAVSEYIPGGELQAHISEFSFLRLQCAKRYAKEILEALRYLQQVGVAHRLLCPSNILLTMQGECKLVNYRCATSITGGSGDGEGEEAQRIPFDPSGCAAEFQAPEVRAGGAPHEHSDIFSFGKVISAMLTGRAAWTNAEEVYELLVAHPQLGGPEDVTQLAAAKDIILSCTAHDPAERVSIEQLAFHPFFV